MRQVTRGSVTRWHRDIVGVPRLQRLHLEYLAQPADGYRDSQRHRHSRAHLAEPATGPDSL